MTHHIRLKTGVKVRYIDPTGDLPAHGQVGVVGMFTYKNCYEIIFSDNLGVYLIDRKYLSKVK